MNEKQTEAQLLIYNEVEKVLNVFVKSCEDAAKSYKGDSVPIDYLKNTRTVFLHSYREGMIGKKKNLRDRIFGKK